jgi:N-acetylglucosamine-6-phosphate deacetylase
MKITNAKIWTEKDGFVTGGVTFSDRIQSIDAPGGEDALDAGGMYLIPGFVDIHIHGGLKHDTSDVNAEGDEAVARRLVKHGVTSYLATTMTMPEDTLVRAVSIQDFGTSDPQRACCIGVHLEGPFFSYRKRGAQIAEYLHKADLDMFHRINSACKNRVRLIAVAPETDGAMDFIEQASKETTVSIGHTCADYDTAMEAFQRGADHVTHLFNGMDPFLHRAPGVVGAAMDANAYVELICDGLHIHPSVVRAVFRMFPERVAMISDAIRSAGLPEGRYNMGGQDITMKDGKTTLPDGTLAGSNITLHDALVNVVRFGVPLEAAVAAATLHPARSVKVDDVVGSIEPGKRADFVLLDEDLAIQGVYHYGKEVDMHA